MRGTVGVSRQHSAGFTLVELIIALVMAGIVMGAVYQLLAKNQRFYRAQSQITQVQQSVRTVAQLLPGDLRELSASEGDITEMGDSAIVIRAMRGFAIICAEPDVATGLIIVRNSQAFGYRAADPTRDSMLVFWEGDSTRASDDRWLLGGLRQVISNTNCADGTAGTTLQFQGPEVANLDTVRVGHPLRVFETVKYEYYKDSDGWYLGIQSMVNGAWTDISPVAGPLMDGGGLQLTYLDADGNATATATDVASIEVMVRGQSAAPIMVEGRPRGFYRDSLRVRVALRNN